MLGIYEPFVVLDLLLAAVFFARMQWFRDRTEFLVLFLSGALLLYWIWGYPSLEPSQAAFIGAAVNNMTILLTGGWILWKDMNAEPSYGPVPRH
jgi:hypothetical protein